MASSVLRGSANENEINLGPEDEETKHGEREEEEEREKERGKRRPFVGGPLTFPTLSPPFI